MQVVTTVNSETTSPQFVALSNFYRELSGVPASAAQPPVDPAELSEPEVTTVTGGTQQTQTRKRRTKAEIEAEAEAQAANEAALASAANAETAGATSTEPVDEFEKAAAASGKTYSEAEVQGLATAVARAQGPKVVKDKIAELGAARIADLNADQLNTLGAYLEGLK